MGSLSLRLKKNYGWNTSIYKFNKKNQNETQYIEKNIIKIINHYFQFSLISKPKLEYSGDNLKIKIYYYPPSKMGDEFKKSKIKNKGGLKINQNLRAKFNYNEQIKKLEKLLKKFSNYNVNIQIIKLKNPILDSTILARFIALNLKNKNISTIWKICLKKIRIKNQNKVYKSYQNLILNFDWNHILKNNFIFNEFFSLITGLKLKIHGRFLKRKGASRTKIKNYSIGSFKFNSISSYIDYGHIEKKDKNGTQSIKVFISNQFFKFPLLT